MVLVSGTLNRSSLHIRCECDGVCNESVCVFAVFVRSFNDLCLALGSSCFRLISNGVCFTVSGRIEEVLKASVSNVTK